MENTSYWLKTVSLPRFPKLQRSLKVDVVVVGGGLSGLTAAYLFKKEGARVALLERRSCGGVDSSHTTAHLTCVTDERLPDLIGRFGQTGARATWEAGLAAIDQIHAIAQREEIDCDFLWVPGYLHAPVGSSGRQSEKIFQLEARVAQRLGFNAEFLKQVPAFKVPGMVVRHGAIFHPLKYLHGLILWLKRHKVPIFENSNADEVVEKPFSVKSGRARLQCEFIYLATHNPLMGKAGLVKSTLFQSKLALYSTYAVGAKLPVGRLPYASWWDTKDPYDYLRVEPAAGFDLAIFGGEDHKTGQEADTKKPFRLLEERLRKLIPEAKVEHHWSGQVIETNDGLPLIGETEDRQFAATGFAGNGMTFGTLGAMMAVDAWAGRKNPWAELFRPQRKKFQGGTLRYLNENKDYPFYMVRDWLGPAEGDSTAELKKGEGKILRLKKGKVAAYRDPKGKLMLLSPVCTHMNCIVGWNPAERTWDCPCHGSRFTTDGKVLAGPAEEPLKKIPAKG